MERRYPSKVQRVVDGDTIVVSIDLGFGVHLDKQTVRVGGVDTPECRTRDAREKKYGLLAKKYVETLCPKGANVTLVVGAGNWSGKFGRTVGEIIVGEHANLSAALITQRLAVPYDGRTSRISNRESHERNWTYLESHPLKIE